MDHYKVLGLEKTATKEEIKAAFKKLALQCHPDKHSQSPKYVQHNAKLRFKQVSEAYEVLMDDRKRAKYNYQSHAGGGGLCRYQCTEYYSKYGYGKSGSGYGDKTRSSGLNGGGGGGGGGFGDKFGTAIRNLTTRSSLLNLGYAAVVSNVRLLHRLYYKRLYYKLMSQCCLQRVYSDGIDLTENVEQSPNLDDSCVFKILLSATFVSLHVLYLLNLST
ncbi:putative DnaJ domain-containing protein [Medicago truncatula]|nr:putative DnaJ domain-containing protein [Medicago truncatula]